MRFSPKKPEISGEWRELLKRADLNRPDISRGQVVDHCFFRDQSDHWQALTQIRDTRYGRVFLRWEQQSEFLSTPWAFHGICWQADHKVGESIGTSENNAIIQAPYVFKDGTEYLLVYGGGPIDSDDKTRQICLARSSDGIHFMRIKNKKNDFSRIVSGPKHAADSFMLKYDGWYYLYVGTPYFKTKYAESAVLMRKSRDLRHWTEPVVVHAGGICGTHTHSSQSIFICFLDGFFYLFKMGWSKDGRTAVYCSRNPEDFKRNDEALLTVLPASAAEIIEDNSKWYISSLILPTYSGVKVATLTWSD